MRTKVQQIKFFINDNSKKNIFKIIKEVTILRIENGYFPLHYFTRLIYRKDSGDYKSYIDFKLTKKLHKSSILHSLESINILENKIEFYEFCSKYNIHTTKLLAYTNDGKLFINDTRVKVDNIESLKVNIKSLIENSTSKSVFLKPIVGMEGEGCFLLKLNDLKNNELIEKIFRYISKEPSLIQETIIQHKLLNKINSSSVNTIRIDTYLKYPDTPLIVSAVMRVGRDGSVIDNASTGGFFIEIDLEQGCLKSPGRQFLKAGNECFYTHPDTGIELDNYKIPFFNEVIKIVKDAAIKTKDRLVGWDVAITENGPIIVEGNHNYDMGMQEIASGEGYKNNLIFKEVLKEINRSN